MAVVQAAPGVATSATATTTVTFASPTTAGNCIVVAVALGNSGATNETVTGVTLGGSAGNFGSSAAYANGSSSSGRAEFWLDPNCAGGQTAVAVTISTTTGAIVSVQAYEISGLTSSPFDQSGTSGSITSGTTFSATSGTTTQAAEIAVGIVGFFTASGPPTLTGPGGAWVNEAQFNENFSGSNWQAALSGYDILTATGTATFSGSSSITNGGSGLAAIITLKVAPSAATPAQYQRTARFRTHYPRQLPQPPFVLNQAAPGAIEGSGTLAGTATKNSSGVSAIQGSGELSGTVAKNAVLTSAIISSGELSGGIAPAFDVLPSAPLFPAGYTNAMVELSLGGTWTDVTPYTMRTPLAITRGHPDESTTTTPSQCTGTLTNESGNFTGRNPLSAFFGSLTRNVPMRVSIPEGASYLRLEGDAVSYASAPDATRLDITGDTDIQLDVTLDNWRQDQVLAAKWAETGSERSWIFYLQGGNLVFGFSTSGGAGSGGNCNSSQFGANGVVPVPPLGRLCVRVTFQASTGNVTFYTAAAGNMATASWTQLGHQSSFGATSIFNSTAAVQVGYAPDSASVNVGGVNGKIHAMLLLNGIGGSQAAAPDFTQQAAGTTSFTDTPGNTWTLHGTSVITNRKYRFHGELSVLPQQWAPTFRQTWCDFTSGGILRRLAQGTNPINSAFYRANIRQTGTNFPVEYWPCEDPAGSSSFASAVGGTPMTFGPATTLASNSSFASSAPIPVLNGAQWTGTVTLGTGVTWTSNVFRFICEVPAAGDTSNGILLRAYTTGTIRRLDLVYASGGGGALALAGYDINGAQIFTSGNQTYNPLNGAPLLIDVELNTSGGNVEWVVATVPPNSNIGVTLNGTTPGSVGAVTLIESNPGGLLTGTAIGHISLQSVSTSIFALGAPLGAWLGETAGNRMSRLCGEEGITFRGKGQLSTSTPMGFQTLQTLPALMQECADTDRGVIFEPRQVLGLGYRCLNSLYNQGAAVPWDFNQNEMDMPTTWPLEDDQRTVNDVTVTAVDGSSSHQVLASGLMSVQAPPNGIGRYAQSYTVNTQTDSQLPNVGGWILHVGAVDEPRYPSIRADLANFDLTATMFYAILDADLGDYTSGANPPLWLPPGLVKQIIQGTTETIWVKTLTVDWACVPESVYEVGIVGDTILGRADTDGSTVNTGISSSATTMLVTSTNTALPLWTTSAGDFPFDIQVNFGEQMTVTNITGASSPQTFTVTRGINGVAVAHNAGEDVRLAHPMIVAL